MTAQYKVGVIADVHGNLPALEAVVRHLRRQGTDWTVNLGDCVTSPLWPLETFEVLASLDMPTVRGNHDRLLAERQRTDMTASMVFTYDQLGKARVHQLHALPPELRWEDREILAVHGRRGDDSAYFLEDNVEGRLALAPRSAVAKRLGDTRAAVVLCGHSHNQHVVCVGQTLVVNPGSVGCPRYADNDDPMIAEPSSRHARYAVLTRDTAGWSVELFALAYDWQAVAARAAANGRSDWAAGFAQTVSAKRR